MMPDTIPVRDLARCSVCPMEVYLSRSSPEEFVEPAGYSVAKQVAAHLGGHLDLAEIWEELLVVRPDAGDAEYARLAAMIEVCGTSAWRQADDTDVIVSSRKYGITGRIDRLFTDGFSLVRSSTAPTGFV